MSYKIKYNQPTSYREFYLGMSKPLKSSKLQDYLKKDRQHTEENNQEIRENVENYKENLKVKDFITKPLISLGTLSLRETDTHFSNSDSMSRNTHPFVKMIAIRDDADDKKLFNPYVYVLDTKIPKLGYREEIGSYTENDDFIQLNKFIKFLLNGKIDLNKYDELDKMKPYQYTRFMRQINQAKILINECKPGSDKERLNMCNNILNSYEQTFDKIENEIKVARTTNRHGTPNMFPYHLQNILSDFIYVKWNHLNFTDEQKELLENVLVDASAHLGGYLIDCGEEPTMDNFTKWCNWINKSGGVKNKNNREKNYSGGCLNMIETEWKTEIVNIFESENDLDDMIDDLEYFLSKENNFILQSMEKISNYKQNYKSISPNFYPIMLMKEQTEPLTDSEYALLKVHTQVDSITKNLYPSWNKWQGKILKELQKGKKSLTKILKEILIFNDSEYGDWYDVVTRDMVYGDYKNGKWASFALLDKLLGYSSFSYTQKGGLIDLISQFKVSDINIRSLEHWIPKSLSKIYGFKGANMYYMLRPDNVENSNDDIKTKLENSFQDLQTTLPIIYGKSNGSLTEGINDIVTTDEWKEIFNLEMTNQDWLNEIRKDNSDIETNNIYNLRIEQLKLCMGMLHE